MGRSPRVSTLDPEDSEGRKPPRRRRRKGEPRDPLTTLPTPEGQRREALAECKRLRGEIEERIGTLSEHRVRRADVDRFLLTGKTHGWDPSRAWRGFRRRLEAAPIGSGWALREFYALLYSEPYWTEQDVTEMAADSASRARRRRAPKRDFAAAKLRPGAPRAQRSAQTELMRFLVGLGLSARAAEQVTREALLWFVGIPLGERTILSRGSTRPRP